MVAVHGSPCVPTTLSDTDTDNIVHYALCWQKKYKSSRKEMVRPIIAWELMY
jgi:hypothetical protein